MPLIFLLVIMVFGSLTLATNIVVLFARPGAGKSTVAERTLKLLDESECIALDLDVCISAEMKENFSNGVYPTSEERIRFMQSACDYVASILRLQDKERCKACLVSFSFVNSDLRKVFRKRFHHSKWVLLDITQDVANERIALREDHFYKGEPDVDSKQQGNEWKFEVIDFPHTILDGLDSIQANAEKLANILRG